MRNYETKKTRRRKGAIFLTCHTKIRYGWIGRQHFNKFRSPIWGDNDGIIVDLIEIIVIVHVGPEHQLTDHLGRRTF